MGVVNRTKLIIAGLMILGGSTFAQPVGDPNAASAGGYVKDTWKPSLRKDGAIDHVEHNHYVTPWQPIREADVLWKKRVWLEIDTRQKQNFAFRYPGDEESGGGMYIEILIDAIKNGKATAFKDDRWTIQMDANEVLASLAPPPDTTYVEQVDGTLKMIIVNKQWDPENITKYRIKQDVIFDKNLGRMIYRIIGIAPYLDQRDPLTGEFRGVKSLFWLHYEDIRAINAKYEVYNPENDVYRITWDDFFEKRLFSSYVLKSNINNVLQTDIEFSKKGIDRLYESEAVKEKLFNVEHDLWVY